MISKKKNRVTVVLLLGLLSVSLLGCTKKNEINEEFESPKRPYPQHTTYGEGIIKPNHITQEEMDEKTAVLYSEWKEKYIKEHPDKKGQYYVWYSDGEWFQSGSEEEKIASTVSEAHGYGMVITAIMAGKDTQAKEIYDGMFYYFKNHPSEINPDLMAWQQGIKDGKVIDIGGADSATDGDMDIAYSLLMADKQWGSEGEINYLEEGKKVINALMESCVDQKEWYLKIGDWATKGNYKKLTRSSDFMLQHLKAFKKATGDDRWDKVIDKTYSIVNEVYQNVSEDTGLLPDFIIMEKGKVVVPKESVLEGGYDGEMDYNACRTYWRIGTDYILSKDDRGLEPMKALNKWIVASTEGNPKEIKPGYFLDGSPLPDRDYADITFSSPFLISAMANEEYQQWLNNLWDYNLSSETKDDYYFSNTIRLLNYITVSGNWWTP